MKRRGAKVAAAPSEKKTAEAVGRGGGKCRWKGTREEPFSAGYERRGA